MDTFTALGGTLHTEWHLIVQPTGMNNWMIAHPCQLV